MLDITTILDRISQPKLSAHELAQQELIETLKLGYWPVHFASDQNHWIATGEALDDSCMIAEHNDIAGYEFKCYILETVAIHLSLYQGNMLDVDGASQLRFDSYNMNTGDLIHMQEYTITGLQQLSDIIDSDWVKFVDQIWPDVCKTIEQNIARYIAKTDLDQDQKIYHDLEEFVWTRFKSQLRSQLESLEFEDYYTLDTLQTWIDK